MAQTCDRTKAQVVLHEFTNLLCLGDTFCILYRKHVGPWNKTTLCHLSIIRNIVFLIFQYISNNSVTS